MDHLQTDIDSLETEKGQLKEKLKSIGKKTISASGTDSMAGGTSITSTFDNKYYVQEINALKEALSNEHQQRKRIMCDGLRQKLESLEPLLLPASVRSPDTTIQELRKKTNSLVKVIFIIRFDPTMRDDCIFCIFFNSLEFTFIRSFRTWRRPWCIPQFLIYGARCPSCLITTCWNGGEILYS